MNADKKRINGNIEVIRYVLTVLVAAMHYWANVYSDASFLEGGYLAVDAFFMISGFFLAVSYTKRSDNPWCFCFHKWKNMLWIYEGSILMSILLSSTGLVHFCKKIILAIPDYLGIQMTGFFYPNANGILWYVSSMLIAGLIVAALYRNNTTRFVNLIAPIVILVSYSVIYYFNGNLDAIGKDTSVIIPFGNLRGLAGMSAGILVFHFAEYMRTLPTSNRFRLFLSVSEVAAILCFLLIVAVFGHTQWDFLALLAIPVILFAAASRQTLWGNLSDSLGNALAGFFGKSYTLAAYAFSTNVYVVLTKLTDIEKINNYVSLAIYLAVWVVFCYFINKLFGCLDAFTKRLASRKEVSHDTKI